MTSHAENVVNYYHETAMDYRLLWTGSRDLAIHFGYYEKGDESHEEAALKMNAFMAERAQIKPGDRVLDAGCGYGGSSFWLAENVGCAVQGVTLAPFQAKKANVEAKKRALQDRVRVDCLNFLSLPYSDASFDVIWGIESVLHAEDKVDFIREASRLLKKDGRLVLAEAVLRENPPLDAKEARDVQTWLDGWAVPNLLTEGRYRQILERGGFKDIEILDITPRVEPSLRRLKQITRLTLPLARRLHALKLVSKVRLDSTLSASLQYDLMKRGLWRYVIVTARTFVV